MNEHVPIMSIRVLVGNKNVIVVQAGVLQLFKRVLVLYDLNVRKPIYYDLFLSATKHFFFDILGWY